MRNWNDPLGPEEIALLQEQFELARQRIEGEQEKPWKQNRHE